MPSDPYLLERIDHIMSEISIPWYPKKMFGGTFYMVNDKMCFGTVKRGLMVRVGVNEVKQLLEKEHVVQMMQKDRIMKGYLLISPEAYDLDVDLEFWIQKCLDYNPLATSSKSKRK